MVYYVAKDLNNPIIIPDGIKPIGSGREGVVYNIGGVAVKVINKQSFMAENKIWTLSSVPAPNLIVMPMQPVYDEADNYQKISHVGSCMTVNGQEVRISQIVEQDGCKTQQEE